MADALSVLDLVAVGEGHTTREALRTSARLCCRPKPADSSGTGSPNTTRCPASLAAAPR